MGSVFSDDSKHHAFDETKIYWDADGNLRHGTTARNRDEELFQLLQNDSNDDSDNTKLWVVMPSRWLRLWLQFSYLKVGEPPGPIDMWPLLQKDASVDGGWRPKKTLKPPSITENGDFAGHYRRVTLKVWLKFVEMYGVQGYAIAVKGIPFDDLSRWRVFKDVQNIDVASLPEPVIPKETDNKNSKNK